jgi:hypothetical protein
VRWVTPRTKDPVSDLTRLAGSPGPNRMRRVPGPLRSISTAATSPANASVFCCGSAASATPQETRDAVARTLRAVLEGLE